MLPATVFIVGAGPGDPSLISVRGLRLLARADVVVHDHLVHPRLLRAARADAECIDVGSAAPQAGEQEAISLLLAEKAREGKSVVRLKWGDPFVFDSGGKEALFLHEQGVRFEIVPGITMPVAGPAFAGIPVTYPGAGDTLTFVRGHEDGSNKAPRVDWAALARLDGTLVCYAGPRQMTGIVTALIDGGRSPRESAALITRATGPRQETVTGTLAELQARVRDEVQKDPAVLVVGGVVGLRDHLRWFDARPLFGKRVLVTRSREQAGELLERLEDLGADAIEAPFLKVAPLLDAAPLDAAIGQAGQYDWIVFTGATSVEHFMRRLQAGPYDVRCLKGPRLCAVGLVTAERLARFGLKVDLKFVENQASAIVDGMTGAGTLKASRVLFPRAEGARDMIAEELKRAGAAVDEVGAYRLVRETHADGEGDGPDIYRLLLDKQIDVVIFTSPSTVKNFAQSLGEEQVADLLQSTVVACAGPVTAEVAQGLQITTTVMPRDYTLPALVAAVVDYYAGSA
jgi:uroporphyrinogen III methyltransferase/synthase